MSISRREFLQAFGISAASASLFGISVPGLELPTAPQVVQGRVLHNTHMAVRSSPSRLRRVWADTIISIEEFNNGLESEWYRVQDGGIPRVDVQPMQPYTPQATLPTKLPVDAEVAGAVGIIREYADANAPLIDRIGHGGVMTVLDMIENRHGAWYSVAENDDILGWTQAIHWRTLPDVSHTPNHRLKVRISRADSTLSVLTRDNPLFTTTISLPQHIMPGEHTITRKLRGTVGHRAKVYRGLPYEFALSGAPTMQAVYWHNAFGSGAPSPHIEMNTLTGKWLYENINHKQNVIIT
ncbi:MAG: SH3 domain-containing protein [Chloroflexota bacterium]